MDSVFDNRLFYNWRMAKRGWPYLVGCLAAAGGAGAFVAFSHASAHVPPFGLTRPEALAGFVVLAIASGILWWRFSSLQDEMFHRIQNYSYGWGGAVCSAVLVVWGVANGAGLAPPIDPIAPLIVFALAKSTAWRIATRKWL